MKSVGLAALLSSRDVDIVPDHGALLSFCTLSALNDFSGGGGYFVAD